MSSWGTIRCSEYTGLGSSAALRWCGGRNNQLLSRTKQQDRVNWLELWARQPLTKLNWEKKTVIRKLIWSQKKNLFNLSAGQLLLQMSLILSDGGRGFERYAMLHPDRVESRRSGACILMWGTTLQKLLLILCRQQHGRQTMYLLPAPEAKMVRLERIEVIDTRKFIVDKQPQQFMNPEFIFVELLNDVCRSIAT